MICIYIVRYLQPSWFTYSSSYTSEKAMASHSSTLAWKIPWMEEPGRVQSMGSLRVGHDWVTSLSLFTFMHWRRKWQPTPVFLPGESQGRGSPVGCRLWGRTVGHDWSDLAASYIFVFSVCVVRTLKIYSLSKFQVYETVLAIGTMMYIRSPELNHVITESLYHLISIAPYSPHPSSW